MTVPSITKPTPPSKHLSLFGGNFPTKTQLLKIFSQSDRKSAPK
ncbi:MAG: hypothetical protein Q3971_07720 [Moraxella sp.]|nr:hypothetical protein [Moraxella sp.]